ncbi:hypothetical protein HDU76_010060, partial [Blyttiomyces sp. JEL0837]
LENLPQHHGTTDGNSPETSVIRMVLHALEVVVQQSSPEIHELVLRRFANHVSSKVTPNATKAVGLIAAISGGTNSSAKLSALLKLCTDNITEELAAGASSIPSPAHSSNPFGYSSMSDARLHWFQYILINTVAGGGAAVLNHARLIEETIREQIDKCRSYRGVKWATKTLRYAISNCAAVYPSSASSIVVDKDGKLNVTGDSFKQWGKLVDANDFTVDWHIPTEAEIDFAVNLITTYTNQAISSLRNIMNSPIPATAAAGAAESLRQSAFEIVRWILVLRNVIVGMSSMIAPWHDKSPVSSMMASHDFAAGKSSNPVEPQAGYLSPSHPHFKTLVDVRFDIGVLLRDLGGYLLVHREDEINPLKELAKTVQAFVSNRGVKPSEISQLTSGYTFAKQLVKSPESGKELPRYLLVKRAHAVHLSRLRFSYSLSPLTELNMELFSLMVKLSMSRYAEIRKKWQASLAHCVVPFSSVKKWAVLEMTKSLQADTVEEFVVKGAFHTISKTGFMELCLKDPE